MSEQAVTSVPEYSIFRNPAAVTLLVIGVLALIAGPIMWTIGANQLAHDTSVAGFEHAFGLDAGVNLDTSSLPALTSDQMLIWWGIGVLVLGIMLLVAFIVVAAIKRPTQR